MSGAPRRRQTDTPPVTPGGLVIVQPDEPDLPPTGQLWYDEDDEC